MTSLPTMPSKLTALHTTQAASGSIPPRGAGAAERPNAREVHSAGSGQVVIASQRNSASTSTAKDTTHHLTVPIFGSRTLALPL